MYGYITWQSHDSHMMAILQVTSHMITDITWSHSHLSHMTVTWSRVTYSHLRHDHMSHMIVTWVTWSHDSHMIVTWVTYSHMSHMTVTWPDTHLQISQGAVSLTIHTSILDNVIKSELQNRGQHTRSQTSTPIVSPIERREKCTIHLRTNPPLHGKPASSMSKCYI